MSEPEKPIVKRKVGRPAIVDEFAGLRGSRQLRYQSRQKRAGLCRNCRKPKVTANYCREHQDKANARARKALKTLA